MIFDSSRLLSAVKRETYQEVLRVATIFVDHFSCQCFAHLQLDTMSEETMAAKIAFEQFAAEHGVKILHYHCDNRQFFDNALSKACHDARQTLFVG
jgi:hypothetical protein